MVTDDPQLFRQVLRPTARLAGLDLGDRTIGLATATLGVGVASPLTTIRRTRFQLDAARLRDFFVQEAVEGVVIGLPLNMDGSAGRRVQATRAFARNLQAFAPPPMLLFDERLSSSTAADAMREAGMSRKAREERIDAYAAGVILQDAIDRLRAMTSGDGIDL